MFGSRRETVVPAGDAAGTSTMPAAARLTRRQRREQRTRTAAEADLAARIARANRRLAQASGDWSGTDAVSSPAPGVPASPPMAHPMPSPDELHDDR